MTSLYSDLPTKSYSLKEFVSTAKSFEHDNRAAFRSFLLTGEAPGYLDTQAYIDAARNSLPPLYDIQLRRDFDSVIGITEDILIDTALSVYTVSNPSEVLSTSIHINYDIPSNNGSESRPTAIHTIPNFAFGYWGNRSMIHIFFPALVRENQRRTHLTEEQKAIFYEHGLRPTIEFLLPGAASEWPASYEQECWRIQKSSGHRAYGTKIVHSEAVKDLAEVLREVLIGNEITWAEGFFFTHTVRGVKHAYQHDLDQDSSEDMHDQLLMASNIPLSAVRKGKWWIDVGLEVISEQQHCLQWSTSSHFHMVQEVLKISDRKASSITRLRSSRYSRDLVSHLTGVSGCRIEPRSAGGEFGAVYFQMYTTDKATTYNPERGHHGKAISTKDVMSPPRMPIPFIEGLAKSYLDSARKTASNARVEVRVPMDKANSVLLEVDLEIIRQSLLAFRKKTWWGYRATKLVAMSQLLTKQLGGPSAFRVGGDALLLTAALVWLINALHSRPDDGSAARSLMRAVLPITHADGADERTLIFTQVEHGLDESDDEGSLPYNPFGAIFLRRIKVNVPVPRMRAGGPYISETGFHYFFQSPQADIRHKYHKVGILERGAIPRRRVPNKAKLTPAYRPSPDEPEGPLFNLASLGHALPPPPLDDGSDNEEAGAADEQGDNRAQTGNIDTQVTRIWRQFLADVAVKSPNRERASAQSYLKLNKEERLRVGEDLYKNIRLSDMWTCVRYKFATESEFNLVFSHLFPIKEHVLGASAQNYRQCQYYLDYKEICANAEDPTVAAIRKEIRRRFNGLQWVPYAVADRMWSTNAQRPAGFTRLPLGSDGPAPRVYVRASPEWISE